MKKLLIFHQALAPYRVDFFNRMSEYFNAELVLLDTNLVNQKFNQKALVARLKCAVSYLCGGFRWKDRYFRIGAYRKIIKVKPDVILCYEYSFVTISVLLYKFLFNRKFKLYTMTDDNMSQFYNRKGLKAFLRWMFVRMLDGVIVTNEETKRAYEMITPQKSDIRYCVMPILHDEDVIRANADLIISAGLNWRNLHLSEYGKVVLYVGRLDDVKNVKWMVQQFQKIKNVALVVVGDGPLCEELKRIVSDLKLENVILVGRKEGCDVYQMISMADALVLASVFEPYGAVVGEALHWGTPCVVSDNVGAKSLIVNDNQGRIFKTGDSVDFEKKLFSVLSLTVNHGKSLVLDNMDEIVCRLCMSMGSDCRKS